MKLAFFLGSGKIAVSQVLMELNTKTRDLAVGKAATS
jgi:hypothetical protein